MGKTMMMMLFLVAAVAVQQFQLSESIDIIVGGTTGWTIPPNPNFYKTWEDGQKIYVGDVLVFNFASNAHTVARVTENSYDSCNTANPITLNGTGPVRFPITRDEDYYFICTIGTHCASGQKVDIDIEDGARPPSAPAPPTTPGTPTTPATPGTPTTPATPGTPTTPATPGTPSPPAGTPGVPTTPAAPPPPARNSASALVSAFSLVSVSIALTLFFNH